MNEKTEKNGTALTLTGVQKEQSIADFYDEPVVFSRTTPTDSKSLEKCGIYERFMDVTFESIQEQGIPKQAFTQAKQISEFCLRMDENLREGNGLTFQGGVGTMKTTFAVAIMRKALQLGYSAYFIPMVSLLDYLFTLRDVEEKYRFEKRLREVNLLVLDDLGAEYDQTWVLAKVDAIVTERYNRKRSTIITTNLSDELMDRKYNLRIKDRLRKVNKLVVFDGKSLR